MPKLKLVKARVLTSMAELDAFKKDASSAVLSFAEVNTCDIEKIASVLQARYADMEQALHEGYAVETQVEVFPDVPEILGVKPFNPSPVPSDPKIAAASLDDGNRLLGLADVIGPARAVTLAAALLTDDKLPADFRSSVTASLDAIYGKDVGDELKYLTEVPDTDPAKGAVDYKQILRDTLAKDGDIHGVISDFNGLASSYMTGRPLLILAEEVVDILYRRLENAYEDKPQDKPIDEKDMRAWALSDRAAAAVKAKELSDFPGVMIDQNGFKRILPANIAGDAKLTKQFSEVWNSKLASDIKHTEDARQVILTELRASDDIIAEYNAIGATTKYKTRPTRTIADVLASRAQLMDDLGAVSVPSEDYYNFVHDFSVKEAAAGADESVVSTEFGAGMLQTVEALATRYLTAEAGEAGLKEGAAEAISKMVQENGDKYLKAIKQGVVPQLAEDLDPLGVQYVGGMYVPIRPEPRGKGFQFPSDRPDTDDDTPSEGLGPEKVKPFESDKPKNEVPEAAKASPEKWLEFVMGPEWGSDITDLMAKAEDEGAAFKALTTPIYQAMTAKGLSEVMPDDVAAYLKQVAHTAYSTAVTQDIAEDYYDLDSWLKLVGIPQGKEDAKIQQLAEEAAEPKGRAAKEIIEEIVTHIQATTPGGTRPKGFVEKELVEWINGLASLRGAEDAASAAEPASSSEEDIGLEPSPREVTQPPSRFDEENDYDGVEVDSAWLIPASTALLDNPWCLGCTAADLKPAVPAEDIAKKFDMPLGEIQKDLAVGTEVEREHTTDPAVAETIATQHENEIPLQYTDWLLPMEEEAKAELELK